VSQYVQKTTWAAKREREKIGDREKLAKVLLRGDEQASDEQTRGKRRGKSSKFVVRAWEWERN